MFLCFIVASAVANSTAFGNPGVQQLKVVVSKGH
jgi:hypothetical protein